MNAKNAVPQSRSTAGLGLIADLEYITKGGDATPRQKRIVSAKAVVEIERLQLRVERLRGLCKWASGRLFDADDLDGANEVLRLVGDMEPNWK